MKNRIYVLSNNKFTSFLEWVGFMLIAIICRLFKLNTKYVEKKDLHTQHVNNGNGTGSFITSIVVDKSTYEEQSVLEKEFPSSGHIDYTKEFLKTAKSGRYVKDIDTSNFKVIGYFTLDMLDGIIVEDGTITHIPKENLRKVNFDFENE